MSLRIKPLKCADKLKGTACDQGYLQGARDLYFEAFFITDKFLYGTGWHKELRCIIMWHPRHYVARVKDAKGFPCRRWGSGGPAPGIFCKYKLWEWHFWAILNAPEKRRKRPCAGIEKKALACQKNVKKGLKGPPGDLYIFSSWA